MSGYQEIGVGAGRTILIVDDNETHGSAISRMLEQRGFHVLKAGTGSRALEIAFGQKPDLVLLDVRLPDVNGLEVCRRIRQAPEMAQVAVVYYTDSSIVELDDVEKLDGDAFLTYPIAEDELLGVIEGTIARRRFKSGALKMSATPNPPQ